MKVRVYLATTRGPVQIVRITPEQADQSVVCLQNTSHVLQPLSAHYHDFVRQPSGVVMRELGPFDGSAFRLDVSSEVGQGDSWQLAVYVAHALAAKGALAAPDEDCDAAVWLTGEVGNDLKVGPVTHISDKLKASRAEFNALADAEVPLTIVLPQANGEPGPNGASSATRIVGVGNAREAVAIAFGVTPEAAAQSASLAAGDSRRAPSPPSDAAGARWPRPAPIVLGLLILGAVIAAAGLAGYSQIWSGFGGDKRTAAPDRPGNQSGTAPRARGKVSVVVSARRPPAGKTCAAVLFDNAEAVLTPLVRAATGTVETVMRDDLCGLDFAVTADGGPVFAAAEIRPVRGRFLDETPLPAALDGAQPLDGRAAWQADLPRRLRGPVEYLLIVVTGEEPVAGIIGWLFSQADRAQAERDLARRGIGIVTISHRVTPR